MSQALMLEKLKSTSSLKTYNTIYAKLAYYSWCLLTSYFCISILYDEKDIPFLVLEYKMKQGKG